MAAFARAAQTACHRVGSHFVLRASRTVKPRVMRRLTDGTRLVGLPIRPPRNHNCVIGWLEVRETGAQEIAAIVLASAVLADERARSCLRAVRQPVRRWPRLLQPQSVEGPVHFRVV